MYQLSIIADSVDNAQSIGCQLASVFEIQCFRRRAIPDAEPKPYTFVDIDLTDHSNFSELRLWLKCRTKDKVAIFAVENGDRFQAAQAYALGATDVVSRPVDCKTLIKRFLAGVRSNGDPSHAAIAEFPAMTAAVDALQEIFALAGSNATLDPAVVDAAGESVVSHIAADGLVHWIDCVRKHHSATYQHCLLVTGTAAAFARQLGFSRRDQQKLAFAGLLHDIGKAKVPLTLLEKPGALDADEFATMKQHATWGFEALRSVKGLHPEMLDMVLHHHEYLDGSGYPHGLRAREIADLVRIMTIADIFAALIERRSYKAAMSGTAAYQVLRDMGPKLDADLLREFEPVSRMQTV